VVVDYAMTRPCQAASGVHWDSPGAAVVVMLGVSSSEQKTAYEKLQTQDCVQHEAAGG